MTEAVRVFKPLPSADDGSKARRGRYGDMPQSHDQAYNRHQDQKPGSPRPASEPAGAERSARSSKTTTDPASGEPTGHGHAPNQAAADERDGAGDGRAKAKDRNLPE